MFIVDSLRGWIKHVPRANDRYYECRAQARWCQHFWHGVGLRLACLVWFGLCYMACRGIVPVRRRGGRSGVSMLSLREAPAPADGWMRHQCVMCACRLRLPDVAFGCFRLLSSALIFFASMLHAASYYLRRQTTLAQNTAVAARKRVLV